MLQCDKIITLARSSLRSEEEAAEDLEANDGRPLLAESRSLAGFRVWGFRGRARAEQNRAGLESESASATVGVASSTA